MKQNTRVYYNLRPTRRCYRELQPGTIYSSAICNRPDTQMGEFLQKICPKFLLMFFLPTLNTKYLVSGTKCSLILRNGMQMRRSEFTPKDWKRMLFAEGLLCLLVRLLRILVGLSAKHFPIWYHLGEVYSGENQRPCTYIAHAFQKKKFDNCNIYVSVLFTHRELKKEAKRKFMWKKYEAWYSLADKGKSLILLHGAAHSQFSNGV